MAWWQPGEGERRRACGGPGRSTTDAETFVRVHACQRGGLTLALERRSQGKEGGGVPAAVLEAAPPRAQLDQHASGQWEVLLLFSFLVLRHMVLFTMTRPLPSLTK